MNQSKKIILVILSLLVGLTFSLPNILIAQKAPAQSGGVFTPFTGGDEDVYAAQIREVYEGKWFSGDAFTYETRNKLPIYQWLTTLILGLMAKAVGSVSRLFILADFFFPAVIFVLIFKFVKQLTRQYWWSVITSLATIFLFQLTNKIPPVTKTLAVSFWNMLTLKKFDNFFFNRLPAPQLTFIFLLVFLVCFYQMLTKKNKFWPIICGFSSGLLAYLYFFHWTASLVALVVCLGLTLLARNKNLSQKLLLALGTAILTSAGFFYQMIFSGSNLVDKQILEGRIAGRFIEPLTTLRYGLFVLIIFWLMPKKAVRLMFASIFMAAVILANLQLIFGFTLCPGHWPNSTFEPLAVITAGILVAEIARKIKQVKWLNYAWILIFPIFLYAVLHQVKIAEQWSYLYYLSPAENHLYAWLNQNSSPDKVVLSLNKVINRRLPALTNQYPYLPYGGYTQISIKELWDRFDLAGSILELKPEFILWLLKNNNELATYMFENLYHFHSLSDLTNLDFPQEIRQIISQIHPFFNFGYFYIPDNVRQTTLERINHLNQQPLTTRICQYKVDYVVLKANEKESLTFPLKTDIFQPVWQEADLTLYQIKPDLCFDYDR